MKVSRRAGVVAAAAALTLTLAACGDSTDEASSEPTETVSEEMAEESEEMTEESEEMAEEPAGVGTVVDVAASTDGFGTLVTAVTEAGLVDTLNGEGPFTVFAPTDEAFAALPPGVLDALLLPENQETLAKILTYHVVPGQVLAADIADGDVATVEGQTIALSTADGVTVNGATVIQADVVADNGVIHVIDSVILPPDVDPEALLAE
ncbi:MAG TPA: fasciclin domain-containing protein [Candidatus Nanopelagicales bacterium]|nr:fasciclin domain-containing protein [Candidatus Nanopelagicales bacterium]